MNKQLSPRPNLDHLRRQAKSLLAALTAGDKEAIETIREYLPAADGMTAAQVRKAGFRLADAQSAIARKTGFASWPQLARHVEQLRSLEGTWEFESLDVDGQAMSAAMFSTSRLLIDGDRFRTETPGAIYEGVFNIDVEIDPHGIDIEFVEGPEAGNWNYGIFRLDGDRLAICLDMNGKARPRAFRTASGTGHAFEILRRSSSERPAAVTGGTPTAKQEPAAQDSAGFEFVAGPTLARLQGDWTAVQVVRDGQELPPSMCKTGRRVANKNEVTVFFGGQVMIHTLVRIVDECSGPIGVDYFNLDGPIKGTIQHGIMEWRSDEVCFCMAAPSQPRPADFKCPAGSGHTFSQWRPATK